MQSHPRIPSAEPRVTRVSGRRLLFLLLGILLFTNPAHALVGQRSPDGLWADVAPDATPQSRTMQARFIGPYRQLSADDAALARVLFGAPREGLPGARAAAITMTLPMPDGGFARFRVMESPILGPKLAAERPDIHTYVAQGVDDPTATARLDITPAGFHAFVLDASGESFVEPIQPGMRPYVSYSKVALDPAEDSFVCHVTEAAGSVLPRGLAASGDKLRTYRLAICATGEYTTFFGGTVGAQNAIVTTVNRVNGIYEKEVAIRLTLVQTKLFASGATDPFPNPDNVNGTLLGECDSVLDADIGVANYDIGHLVGKGSGGGLASLGVVCSSNKGRGATNSGNPQGDAYDVDYVAHEMGHQFGGDHTFNGTTFNCGGGNRVASSAYEPGSGTTIMAYAGICREENIAAHSDPFFHTRSFDQITAFRDGSGSCGVQSNTGNTVPTVNAGSDFTIPRGTPFTLTATGNDGDGDPLTYCWEEFDLGDATGFPTPLLNPANSPLFKFRPPTASASRTIPALSDLLAGSTPWEPLPTADRDLHFRCTVRDNRAGGGGVNYSSMVVHVAGAPFAVTSPNGGETLHAGCGTTVTWSVGGGSVASDVRILLSTDGGNTWSTLVGSTPNDGSESLNVPCVASNQGRIRIEAIGNIFFDVSNANFQIVNPPPSVALTFAGGTIAANCSITLPVHAIVTDDCALAPGDVTASVLLAGGGATISSALVKTVIGPSEVHVDGTVTVSDITACPAQVDVKVEGKDACGAVGTQHQTVSVNETEPPVVAVSATGGDVGPACTYLMPFTARVTDNCRVDAADVQVLVSNPSANATLDPPTISKVQTTAQQVDITGTVLVSDLTSCPAVIQVDVKATDVCGNAAANLATAQVFDRIPPTIAVTLNRTSLWPPNHSMADISASVSVADNCPNATFVLTSITSNEPEDGLGDGDTAPDIAGADFGTPDTEFQLRSERAGPRSGREYTIVYTASDHCGNSASATVKVRVAHDQSGNAFLAAGFAPDGSDLDPQAKTITVVLPSLRVDPENIVVEQGPLASGGGTVAPDGGEPISFDATQIATDDACIGNVAGAIHPLESGTMDVDGDGLVDRVLTYAAEDVRRLKAAVSETSGPIGLHYEDRLGESFLVPDLFALGPQAMVTLPAGVEAVVAPVADAARPTVGPAADAGAALPVRTALAGVWPTPFRGSTAVVFDLAQPGRIELSVWNLRGTRVRALASGSWAAGRHSVAWDGRDDTGRSLPAGMYLVRFEAPGTARAMKAMMMR